MESNNKKKLPVIIILLLLIIAMLAGAGAAYYFCFRPIVKVNKAIEAEDYEEVSRLFDKLNDTEKEEVREEMSSLASDLRRDYEKEKAEYDDVIEVYDILGDKILEDDDDLKRDIEKIEDMKTSREAFAAGKAAMDKEDYKLALDEFAKVIKKDSNYDQALELISECQKLLPANVVGSWVSNYNISEILAEMIGDSNLNLPELTIPIYVDFNEDNSGKVYTNSEDLLDIVNSIIESSLPYFIKQYSDSLGMTEDEINSMSKMLYGKSIKDYIRDEMKKEIDSGALSDLEVKFTYEADGGQIKVSDDLGAGLVFTIDNDKLYMDVEDFYVKEAMKQYKLQFPMEFERKDIKS